LAHYIRSQFENAESIGQSDKRRYFRRPYIVITICFFQTDNCGYSLTNIRAMLEFAIEKFCSIRKEELKRREERRKVVRGCENIV
jgi:hypothetical protein